jgi:hypothetical protein
MGSLMTQQNILVNTNPLIPLADVESYVVDALSATLVPGNCVCVTSTGTVTLALAAALALANGCLGVAITGGAPGDTVQIREDGLITPNISGLLSAGLVRVNPATGALQVVGSLLSTDYPMGSSNAQGYVTMNRTFPPSTSGGVSVTGTGFWHSTAGALDPAAATVLTQPTTNPAASGFVRVAVNQIAVAARNAANTADIPLVQTDVSGNVTFGDTSQGGITVLAGKTGLALNVGATQIGSLAAASGDFLKLGAPTATGSAFASAGYIRFGDVNASALTLMACRNSTNTADLAIISTDGGGTLQFGYSGAFFGALSGGALEISGPAGSFLLSPPNNALISFVLPAFKTQSVTGVFTFDSVDALLTGWNHSINGTLITSITPTQFVTKKGLNRAVRRTATSTTVTASDDIVVFSATGQTATLPVSPAIGDKYTIGMDAAGVSNTYLVNPNGHSLVKGGGTASSTLTITTTAAEGNVSTWVWDGFFWLAALGY